MADENGNLNMSELATQAIENASRDALTSYFKLRSASSLSGLVTQASLVLAHINKELWYMTDDVLSDAASEASALGAKEVSNRITKLIQELQSARNQISNAVGTLGGLTDAQRALIRAEGDTSNN